MRKNLLNIRLRKLPRRKKKTQKGSEESNAATAAMKKTETVVCNSCLIWALLKWRLLSGTGNFTTYTGVAKELSEGTRC